MIYLRIIIIALNVLLLVYYATVIAQSVGLIQFTKRDIVFKRAIIPFYYWVAPEQKKKASKKKNIVKPIKTKHNA